MSRPMEINVWAGDWGLPSIDVNCLQILTYCKFAGAPVQVNTTSNPYRTPLPTFKSGESTFHKLSDVVLYLKEKKINAEHHLDSQQLLLVQTYEIFLEEKLYPALQYVWWVDSKNFPELTRPWYARALPFPLNYYYPGRYERAAKNLMRVLYGELEEDPASVETMAYSDAEKCITQLSNRLGSSPFFFKSGPSSLDALVFGYLAPLLLAPFPSPALQNHLKGCTNLVAFVNGIIQKYYPSLKNDFQKKTAETKREESDAPDFPHKTRNKFLFGLLTAGAMTGYALTSGILQVKVGYDEEDEDSDYYDQMYEDPGGRPSDD